MSNDGQIKIDNKERRINILIPSKFIDNSYKAKATSDYELKKQKERKEIIDQLNRVND